jgi:hypothetical protein
MKSDLHLNEVLQLIFQSIKMNEKFLRCIKLNLFIPLIAILFKLEVI